MESREFMVKGESRKKDCIYNYRKRSYIFVMAYMSDLPYLHGLMLQQGGEVVMKN